MAAGLFLIGRANIAPAGTHPTRRIGDHGSHLEPFSVRGNEMAPCRSSHAPSWCTQRGKLKSGRRIACCVATRERCGHAAAGARDGYVLPGHDAAAGY
jgi:hypothetical protein